MEFGYTPYKSSHKEKGKFKLPRIKIPKSLKFWVGAVIGFILLVLMVIYLLMGQLRFFANHFLGMTFFSKNYLIVLQNDYELRPGGGFITGYGNLDFMLGWPKNLSFGNSYNIDTENYITPPYPHEELLKNEWYEGYTFRDANWSPDTRKNAKELTEFYNRKFPDQDIDGLITVNFSVIENLVEKLGGIQLNGKQINRNNLFSELEFEVNNIDRHNIDALAGRKDILSELAHALIAKAKHHPLLMRDALTESLNHKDMYLWVANEKLENKLISKGWANTLDLPERSDFFSLNLANLGSKKADRYMQKEVNFYANVRKELPEIAAEITLRHPGFLNTYSDNYKGYLRVYLPKSATIENAPVDSIEEIEGDFRVIGTKVIIPSGSKTNLTITYTLPRNSFELDKYKLRLIKQSGDNTFYNITAEGPEGKLTESTTMTTRENRAIFQGFLTNDIDLDLQFLPDTLPPYPIEQEFVSMDQINVIWNEPLSNTEGTDLSQFTISDLNKSFEETDVVNIKSIELMQPNVLKFEIEGITEQNEEFYRLDMKGVTDVAGNVIQPNPKSITIVQRIKPKSSVPEIKLGEIPVTEETSAEIPAQ